MHQLKGASGSVFALDIAKNAIEAEESAKKADIDILVSSVREIERKIGSL